MADYSDYSDSSTPRFVSKAGQVLSGANKSQLSGSIDIIQAIINSTSNNLNDLLKGLSIELGNDASLNSTWKMAEEIYEKEKRHPIYNQEGIPKEYHVALIVYVLKYWYGKFNETTRTINSVSDVKSYQYKNFFKLLLLAVVHVKGDPYNVPLDMKLYRGMSGHMAESYKEGSYIAFQHFASTSRSVDIALGYAGQGDRTLFVISGIMPSGKSSGHKLGVSGCPNTICLDHIAAHNQECLIWPCELFKVEKVEKRRDGLHIIYLKADK